MREKLENNIKKIAGGFSLGVGVIIFILSFITLKEPDPVGEDYLELYKLEETYKYDLKEALKLDKTTISVSEDSVEVSVQGNNCKIISTFDRDFNYVSSDTEITTLPMPDVIVSSLVLGCCGLVLALGGGFVLLHLANLIWIAIDELIQKIREKIEERKERTRKFNEEVNVPHRGLPTLKKFPPRPKGKDEDGLEDNLPLPPGDE